MFQRNGSIRTVPPEARRKPLRRWLLLLGIATLCGGAVACAPAIEENAAEKSSDPALDDSPILDDLSTATDSASADALPSRSDEILLIEPSPDREVPLRDCGSLQKQQAMNACAYENYQTVDAELNAVYQQMRNALSEAGKQSLETAELAWIEYRDLDCGFERAQFEGGSIAPLIYHSCMEARTNIRVNELTGPVVAESSYAAADSALNAAYQGLTGAVSDRRAEGLVDAQLAWIEYRDRHCEFEANYGAAEIQADQCKARLSEKRTRQIRAAIEQSSL